MLPASTGHCQPSLSCVLSRSSLPLSPTPTTFTLGLLKGSQTNPGSVCACRQCHCCPTAGAPPGEAELPSFGNSVATLALTSQLTSLAPLSGQEVGADTSLWEPVSDCWPCSCWRGHFPVPRSILCPAKPARSTGAGVWLWSGQRMGTLSRAGATTAKLPLSSWIFLCPRVSCWESGALMSRSGACSGSCFVTLAVPSQGVGVTSWALSPESRTRRGHTASCQGLPLA